MSANFYLPQKTSSEVNYTITVPGTYTWTAPQTTTPSAPYLITLQMWSGGGSGSRGDWNSVFTAGSGGGGGSYVYSQVTVVPGTVYTMVVGAGGAAPSGANYPTVGAAGGNGGSTYIQDGSGQIIRASGGTSAFPSAGVGGSVVITQPSKCSGTLSINGASGGIGGTMSAYGANGSAVSPAYGQPGGAGGLTASSAWTNRVGGGGGGSPFSTGGNSGTNNYNNNNTSGGGGGAGYSAGNQGSNIAPGDGGGGGTINGYHSPGGPGGNGRLTFLFITTGSHGVAPV